MMSAVFFEIMAISFALPVAECELNITTKSQYGIVSGCWFVGFIVTSHFWGLLSDVYGRRKILTIAPMLCFLTSIMSSISIDYRMLAVLRFLNGVW